MAEATTNEEEKKGKTPVFVPGNTLLFPNDILLLLFVFLSGFPVQLSRGAFVKAHQKKKTYLLKLSGFELF